MDALRPRLEREQAPGDLLAGEWLAELVRLLPEVREHSPAPTAHEPSARLRLFEAVTRLVQAWIARHPLVFVLDDVHWTDSATLDLVQYLARSWAKRATPILLLLSWSPEEVNALPMMTKWLSTLERGLPLSRLALGPLSKQDTLHWLHALQAGRSHEAHTQDHAATRRVEQLEHWLYSETGGHPFYLHELLKTLLERGLLTLRLHEEGVWGIDMTGVLDHATLVQGIVPPAVRDMICTRLDLLSPPARTLLAAGAVLGKQATFDQMRQVASVGENEGLVALDELLHSHLLTEMIRTDTEGSVADAAYTFAYTLVRKVVYHELGAARQHILQRRARLTMPDSSTSAADLVSSGWPW